MTLISSLHMPVRGEAVAVALSGGPDSMALLWLLARGGDAEIHALTVDHGLRPGSDVEAAQVGAWVKDWPGVKHTVLSLGADKGPRLMERAREGRYALMAAYCRARGIEKLYVAHHRDDQAETFLFRLAKGSGLDGLCAMRPAQAYDEALTLVRPLLDVPKDELVALCHENDVPFVKDPTNDNPAFARNRVRAALEGEGMTVKRLAVTAARLLRARDALDHYARAAYEEAVRERTERRIVLDAAVLAAHPAEIRLRVLLAVMDDGGYGPRREAMEALAESLFSGPDFRKQTLGGRVFSRDERRGLILVEAENPCLEAEKV